MQLMLVVNNIETIKRYQSFKPSDETKVFCLHPKKKLSYRILGLSMPEQFPVLKWHGLKRGSGHSDLSIAEIVRM
jgi:hypothetical protein